MKKVHMVLVLMAVTLGGSSTLFAGNLDYLSNQSADYMRTMSRNAATDAADIVVYNPAGTSWMEDGLYLNLNSQTLLKNYKITYDGTDYTSNTPTLILPSFFAVYKKSNLAVFGGFTVPAGGGSLTYEDGVPYLYPLALVVTEKDEAVPTNALFEGSSIYLAGTIGASYKLFNMVSFSAAGRVISASKEYKGQATYAPNLATLNAKKSAMGFGGIFGINIRPMEALNIGIHYDTPTPLTFKTTNSVAATNTNCTPEVTCNMTLAPGSALESFSDGFEEKRNLPGKLGVGISYEILSGFLAVNSSWSYYFVKQADDMDDVEGALGYVRSYDDDYGNGMDLAFSVELRPLPKLIASAGFNHTWLGGGEDTYYDFEYALDANTFAVGAKYGILERLNLTGAFAGTFYQEGQNAKLHTFYPKPETFNKSVFTFALGAEYRFL